MKFSNRNSVIVSVAIAVIIIAPLIAHNYLEPKPVQINTTPGIANYNFSGNYNSSSSNPLFSPNYTSTGYAVEKNGLNSSLALRVSCLEYLQIETKSETYVDVQMKINITGNFAGNIGPSNVSLYLGQKNGKLTNQTLVQNDDLYHLPHPEINVSYNWQYSFQFYGKSNHTQNIKLLNQNQARKSNTSYHFIYNTGINLQLYQSSITHGSLLYFKINASVNGLSSPMYAQMIILLYNNG